ncbi:MAG: hypothetical protein Hens2KO_28040 [Henriciella sp.]
MTGLLMGHGAWIGPAAAQGVLGDTAQATLDLSVDLEAAPAQIQISGLSEIAIDKTVGDAAIDIPETTACVYMEGGDQYSVTVTANALSNNGNHYPYKIEAYQSTLSSPRIELNVSASVEQGSAQGFQASTQQGCAGTQKLLIRVTDVGSSEFTEPFSASTTIIFDVQPE